MLELLDILYNWLYDLPGYVRGIVLASPIAIFGYAFIIWTYKCEIVKNNARTIKMMKIHQIKRKDYHKWLIKMMWKRSLIVLIIILITLFVPGIYK